MSTCDPQPRADFMRGMRPDAVAECQHLFDEQAARLECDSGYPRADAERIALEMLPAIINDPAGGAA